ncbi:MAG: hypothetical protein K2O35_03910 [Clostridia bacterium]|nr:hypothetical protein [Clostridia bacterium]
MTQESKRKFLIDYLLSSSNAKASIPDEAVSQKRLLRALLNMRMPRPLSAEFLQAQDEYLQEE